MSQHTIKSAVVGILVLPGMLIAGYPDVPRSHWAAPAVDKLAQEGIMTSRSDGRFAGDKPATRYEVAQAVANAMAELNNRLIAEGRNPEELVPYIERINLYVADEIDHLKQAQKELRATMNELLERMDRREAHSAPLPPPCPPEAHPHVSTVPFTELRQKTEVSSEQRIHPVEGAATVHESTAQTFAKFKTRTAEGKIGAVEGAAPVIKTDAEKAEEKKLTESFEKRISTLPSDNEAWQHQTGTTKDEADAASPSDKSEAVAADEHQPDIGTKGMVPGEDKMEDPDKEPAPQPEKPKKEKHAKKAKSEATPEKAATPIQTSEAPRTAPSHFGGIDTEHGAAIVPEGAPTPFAVGEEHDSPVYPGTTDTAKQLKKAIQTAKADKKEKSEKGKKAKKTKKKKSEDEATDEQVAAAKSEANSSDEDAAPKHKESKKSDSKPAITVASAATVNAPTAEEVLGGPETAQDEGGPSDEQLSNWRSTENGTQQSSGPIAPVASSASSSSSVVSAPSAPPANIDPATGLMQTVAPPATPVAAAIPNAPGGAVRSAAAADILAQLRAHVPAKQ